MQRLLSVPPLRTSSFSQTYVCKSCNAYLTGIRLLHSSEIRQRPDENDRERQSRAAPAQASNQNGDSGASPSSPYPRNQRAQRAADTAATAAGLLSSARSQQAEERQQSPSSSSSSSSSNPAPGGALDLRSQAAKPSGESLIRRTMTPPRARSAPGQEQPVIRRIRQDYGADDSERGRVSAGARGRGGGGGGGGYGARGRGSRYNNRDTDRGGPQRYRPNRSHKAKEKSGEGGDDASGKSRKFGGSAPKTYLLSDTEIQHLIAQRDRAKGRPQPVKPTVGITNDTEYFRDVPDSGALIRGKEAQKKDEEEGQEDNDHEISSINAAEAEVAARLRVVASTAGTRYTSRLGTRLLQGRYVELYDQEGHVDRVLDEAREEQVKKNKQKKSKKAAAEDEAYLEELAAAASPSSSSASASDDTNAANPASDTAAANPTTVETALRTIQDPRGRWRPVDFEPLGSAEIDFLARELVGGKHDDAAAAALSESETALVKEKEKSGHKPNSNDIYNSDGKAAALSEATRQAVLNGTYLPKDVRTFRRTLETVLAGGYAVPVGAEADVIGDRL